MIGGWKSYDSGILTSTPALHTKPLDHYLRLMDSLFGTAFIFCYGLDLLVMVFLFLPPLFSFFLFLFFFYYILVFVCLYYLVCSSNKFILFFCSLLIHIHIFSSFSLSLPSFWQCCPSKNNFYLGGSSVRPLSALFLFFLFPRLAILSFLCSQPLVSEKPSLGG